MIRMRGLCFSIALISLPSRSHKADLQTPLRAILWTIFSPYSECKVAREAPLPFVICHLSFAICHLSFVICHLPFVICHLLNGSRDVGQRPMTNDKGPMTNDE